MLSVGWPVPAFARICALIVGTWHVTTMPMRVLRLIVALFVVLGLTVPTARAMVATSFVVAKTASVAASAMDDCDGMSSPTTGKEDCPCCDVEQKCPPNVCASKCLKTVNADSFSRLEWDRSDRALEAVPVATLSGRSIQPPPRPPRV